MLRSATRIALPAFDPAELRKLIERFVALEGKTWLPDDGDGREGSRRGSFLYLRPTMIGTGNALGVQRPTEALLFLVAVCFPALDEPHKAPRPIGISETPLSLPSLPVSQTTSTTTLESSNSSSSSSSTCTTGMRLLASRHDSVRAWPGGIGHAKVGANYGPSLLAQQEARENGYDQILWLFGTEAYITEAGASNFFVLWRTTTTTTTTTTGMLQLVTAPLGDGVILEGVTRASVLQLVRERCCSSSSSSSSHLYPSDGGGGGKHEPVEVIERSFTMAEVVAAEEEGRLVEAFGCGTAFFIAPVQDIHFRGRDVELPLKRGVEPAFALMVKRWLREIMFGVVGHEWGLWWMRVRMLDVGDLIMMGEGVLIRDGGFVLWW